MTDPFEDQALPPELTGVWRALEEVPGTTVSEGFEGRLMAQIEHLEDLDAQKSLRGEAFMQRWWQALDGLFDFLHVPALAIVIALLFWLPTSSPQTAYRLDFPSVENPRSMQNHGTYIFEPQKILKLLIYISRS